MFQLVLGSGKTYTVVKKIEKELQEIENYQGIIACSFTKEASEELKDRINKKFNLDNCFIGTIDSYDNTLDKYKYPFEKIEPLLLNCNSKIKPKDFKIDKNIDIVEFLEKSCDIIGVSVSKETINEIKKKLEDEKYKYNYYVVEKQNRIMTIHSSKGLENDNVVIVLDNSYNRINDEFKNKLFVAITRARNNVYILTKNNNAVKDFLNNLLK